MRRPLIAAAPERWEDAELLRALLVDQAAGRDQATIHMRRRVSALPGDTTFDS